MAARRSHPLGSGCCQVDKAQLFAWQGTFLVIVERSVDSSILLRISTNFYFIFAPFNTTTQHLMRFQLFKMKLNTLVHLLGALCAVTGLAS